jgi:two-component system, OmpR family, sensor histidine kinase CreC
VSISARILLGSLILSIAGVFLFLSLVSKRVGQAYREAVEEPMVDTAEVIAGVIANEVKSTGSFSPAWERGFRTANQRQLHAQIYSRLKTRISMDLYVTDSSGIVQFDSGHPENVGRDFKAFHDVAMTLQGHYGARTTLQESDPKGAILYVAAPIMVDGVLWGVVSVYKPQRDVGAFLADTERTLTLVGLSVVVICTLIGAALSRWVTAPLAQLTQHAIAISKGERPVPLRMPGRHLRVLGESLEQMRDALEGRKYVQSYVQALSHEMKAPVAAISGASELLQEEMATEQRARFLSNIRTETNRLQRLIDELVALSVIENRKKLEAPQRVDLSKTVERVVDHFRERASSVNIDFTPNPQATVIGDEFLLENAVTNLLQNAIEFSPTNGKVAVAVEQDSKTVRARIFDDGPGIPDYAVNKIFDRFYSLARPTSGKKSSGLGLCFAREVAHLHHGSVTVRNRVSGQGAEALLTLPTAPETENDRRYR